MTGQSSPAGDNPGDLAPPACTIEHHRSGQVAVVAVTGTVDMLTAPQLAAAIRSAAQDDSPAALLVDLTEVGFLASAGMGALAAANEELAPGIRFVLVADGPATRRPLELVGIAEIVELFATRDEALAAVAT
ncbi:MULTISPECIES: STAS domain-containing protein [Mycobacteriaceae]|uniref:STAS domain-containing protein n=1 Tax=Mycobacteriaceae TaxID=1762 RepID=UPI001CFA3DED|nr:STAS domain-containing protein [Mycolicibacterium phocaicum]UCZ60070.1 STAS domain-containing protein [Mycolicibacterium phocaicum]